MKANLKKCAAIVVYFGSLLWGGAAYANSLPANLASTLFAAENLSLNTLNSQKVKKEVLLAESPTAVYAPQRSHSEVFFRGTDGYLHYYYVENGAWKYDNTSFRASQVSGDITAVSEMLNPNTKLYISSYTNSKKLKIVNMTSSPQTNEHN
ncbi:MAG: hypothetical protein RM022_030520 [Nostoc sp. EfeVER01]|uniref:hypothetical protein n=1 Tax=Nostoc sp. EfeVER01 TaxID=3075406 RepID=UPI002AD29B51|nr:hypothetical protein [Nostoc sp. EfeVER01]MDZ7945182.1 hypothetical protein [Nostoc sp. EfeVER01]